jgi:pimeloyl-ACP methyl ester carboxylesterase
MIKDFVTVGDHRLSFTRKGHGQSLVLLHGIRTSACLWRNVVPPLVGAGFEVITFDLRAAAAWHSAHPDTAIMPRDRAVLSGLHPVERGGRIRSSASGIVPD